MFGQPHKQLDSAHAPVPDYSEAVTIFAHSDEAAQRGARELADVLDARGIEIRVEGFQR